MTPTGSASLAGPAWADAHLDLAYLAVNGRDMRAAVAPDAPHALGFPALREGGVRLAFGTIFTELGGDSIAAARIIARATTACGVALPMPTLFHAPTVALMAEVVAAARAG